VSSEQFRAQDCLADIVDNIERIERHVVGLDRDHLAIDGLRRDGVERCLERICEEASASATARRRSCRASPGEPFVASATGCAMRTIALISP